MLGAIQSVAPSLKVEISPINVRDAAESERAVTAFVRGADDGLIVLPGLQTVTHRQLFVTLAARHKLPTVYPYRYVISSGGLILLWARRAGAIQAGGRLCRPHPQG